MASPFTFFRKYSSGMMIVLVILSMLLFTLTDLFSDPSAKYWLLGLLVGGTVFGVAGISQGKWLQWGIGGSVLGIVMGLILPAFAERGGISTIDGVVTAEEQDDMYQRRMVANSFLSGVVEQTYGPIFFQFQQPPRFGFGQRSEIEDLIFGKLMRAEADRLGLEVSPAMVKEYLANITGDQLTKEQYLTVRNALSYNGQPLSEKMVNEILGDEIRAQMAWQLTVPLRAAVPPSPEVYWEYYKRMKVQQDLELVAVNVEEFLDEVKDPSDAEVSALFEKYKNDRPNQQEAGSPGFFLPTRVKIAYAELDTDGLKKDVAPVTDEEIQQYYEDNKESPLIKTPVFPDVDPGGPSGDEPPADEPQTDEPQSDEPQIDEPQTDEPQSDEPQSDEPQSDEPPADEPQSDEPPADEPQSDEPQSDEPQSDEPQSDEPQSDEPPADDCGVFQEETADEPAEPTEDAPQQESEANQSDGESQPQATEGESGATEESPSTSLVIPAKPAAGTDTPPEFPEPTYEYRELDDELRKEIKEVIEAERLNNLIEERLKAVKNQMELVARERQKQQFGIIDASPSKYEVTNDGDKSAYDDLRAEMRPLEKKWNAELKAFVKKQGFAYVETPLLGYADFVKEDDYPIALSTEPVDNPMAPQQSAVVAQTVFQNFNQDSQNNNAQLYIPRQAQKTDIALTGGTSHYVYWAIDSDKAHLPKLDEPGVRETVVRACKTIKARDLAKARAEELASKIRSVVEAEGTEEQDFATILKDETAAGAALAPRRTLPFSWMKTSSAGARGMQQQAVVSNIEFRDEIGGSLDDVGLPFMETVFDDFEDEEVGVVPNYDLSKYYVIHVQNRFPTADFGEDGLRDQFATEGKQFSFRNSAILTPIRQDLGLSARQRWEMDVWKKYGVIGEDESQSE